MDADVLESLYRKYYHAALMYCTALCGNIDLAHDLVSDAFVKAYLSLPNEVISFQFWLFRVCKNLWIDHLRRHSRELSGECTSYLRDTVCPESRYLRNERNQCLWQAILSLSDADRELLTLHYFSGLSMREIAEVTGKNPAAIRQRMVRLRHILKEKMEEQGYGF